jgi:hypothetical protein
MSYVTICPQCREQDSMVHEANELGGETRCGACGHRFGVWLDKGKLDLGLIPPSKPPSAFDVFFEKFETIPSSGCGSLRAHMRPLTRRELIWRHFRTRLSIRPSWKPCIPISCPPIEEHTINWTSDPHQ